MHRQANLRSDCTEVPTLAQRDARESALEEGQDEDAWPDPEYLSHRTAYQAQTARYMKRLSKAIYRPRCRGQAPATHNLPSTEPSMALQESAVQTK
jgi:hypothetical protein